MASKEKEISDDVLDKELLAGLDAEELEYKKVIPIAFLLMMCPYANHPVH